MKNYTYKNTLIGKKQLKQLLAWSFTKYNSMQACLLADELKYLGFKYASQAGISISIEDLRVPFVKYDMLEEAHKDILNAEKIYLKGKITDVERFQKIIDTWSITSESLKNEVVSYFNNYDPLNSIYIMAFSGARGNLSQVRQLVGMRGLMSDPSGEILKLPIKKNFREGLTITDYLMSGYGARKGIVDTALKTANSGYLTRRLIDVAQDIIIREKDCKTTHSCLVSSSLFEELLGRVISKAIHHPITNTLIAQKNQQITRHLINIFKHSKVERLYIRSPLTCNLYRSICQKCYGWDLANENLVDIGEAIGIIAGQSIGEPGTQLTMRTFHTGGIFTSELRQQIISNLDGVIQFSKVLKTQRLRTNRGDDVLLVKNSGSIVILPKLVDKELLRLEILPNTILFTKNNDYVTKGTILGELSNTEKQIRTEIKPILSLNSGEVFMPRLKSKTKFINKNKLLWVLYGQLYKAPEDSFLNFYTDHKINKNSYIFRTKLINQYPGFVTFASSEKDLFKCNIQIKTNAYTLPKYGIKKILNSTIPHKYVLLSQKSKYWLNLENRNSELYINQKLNDYFACQITNDFKTKTGGLVYYDTKIYQKGLPIDSLMLYFKRLDISTIYEKTNSKKILFKKQNLNKTPLQPIFGSVVWLPEETYKLNCDKNILFVENGSFISENFELLPGLLSKTSGIINIVQKSNIVNEIIIKCGLVYEGKDFKNFINKIFYPGEVIFKNIKIDQLSLCQHIVEKQKDQLLIRPLNIYEVPKTKTIKTLFDHNLYTESILNLKASNQYLYKCGQKVKTATSLNLTRNIVDLSKRNSYRTKIDIQFSMNANATAIEFLIKENLYLPDYLQAYLKYTDMTFCKLVESNQFVDAYSVLGFFEIVTLRSLEIVKIKTKLKNIKQILLISNDDCLTIRKIEAKQKLPNDLIVNVKQVNQIGKIIIDNGNFLTIQKGRPYFFPNCQTDNSAENMVLRYKLVHKQNFPFSTVLKTKRSIFLHYYDVTKKTLRKEINSNFLESKKVGTKFGLSKMFIKKYGKLYSSPIPIFLNNFLITGQKNLNDDFLKLSLEKTSEWTKKSRIHYSVFLKNSEFTSNKIEKDSINGPSVARVRFFGYPFSKSIGIHSITENYFEQEINSVFCKNGEFISNGQTLGLLNFEKEITGDIVQGLPRIEELLEARKKKQRSKNIPINHKKSLLIQQTGLDSTFEFRKLGTTIKENEKINPHNLLKAYFNYYGSIKLFTCDRTKIMNSYRLINNYESSYKSFKKVQSLILSSVQSVYKSQGVTISDKHLEVIIKQMTTKVLITHEGDTPLLPREVIDLYHIQYINEIIALNDKQIAFYVPLLLGITKAALNNPSFISAASFQETTNVLTKAAIEGRVDWLRGLKENIIIGHLIPAGTGCQNYHRSFSGVIKNLSKSKSQVTTAK